MEPSFPMRTDRQTDTMKLVVTFRNFAKAPKNLSELHVESNWHWLHKM